MTFLYLWGINIKYLLCNKKYITSVAVNPIRDTYFASNPELYCKIANKSTIISTMGTPVVKGVPIEKVMATQAKRLASGAVGSIASNAIMDRYDLNPYVAMGIGMGISGLAYRGINVVGNMDYVNRFGVKPVEAIPVDSKGAYTSFGELMSAEEKVRYDLYWDYAENGIDVEDRVRLSQWKHQPKADLYKKHKDVYDNPKYYDQVTGRINWPNDNGFLEGTKEIRIIKKGTIFKRIGEPSGQYLGNVEDSFDKRSLAPHSEGSKEYYYILLKDYEMTTGKAAPWFNKPGGGEQFIVFKNNRDLYTIEELEKKLKILKNITNSYTNK